MKAYLPLILDLKSLVYNSYHTEMTTEPLRGDIKMEVNTAEKGFSVFLTKFFDPMLGIADSPLHMIAALDDGNLYRQTVYPDYKANHTLAKSKADAIEQQQLEKCMELVKEFLTALGVTLVKLPNQEADDLIAYLVEKLHPYSPVTVATIDKDLLQLSPKAGIFRNGKLQTEFKQGLPNHLIALYLSVVGDSSDGFPGVVGVGEKGWESMVNDFGVDGLEQLDELIRKKDNGAIRRASEMGHNATLKKLAANFDHLAKQYELARLHPELCEGAKVTLQWRKRCPTLARLLGIAGKAGGEELVTKYGHFCYTQTLVTTDNLDHYLSTFKGLLEGSPCVPFDYETTDKVQNPKFKLAAKGRTYVDMLNSEITGCSFAVGNNLQHVFYFSVGHRVTDNVDKQAVLEVIRLVESKGLDMPAHNIQFESTVTKVQLGHELACYEDTRCYSHHIDENTDNDLKSLSKSYLNYQQKTYQETLEDYQADCMADITGPQVLSYGADDSLVTGHLYQLFTLMARLEGTYDFIREYECPSLALLKDSYISGVQIDGGQIDLQRQEDIATVRDSHATLISLLEEHCKEPNYAAISLLYEDQKAYITYKAKHMLKLKDPSASYDALETSAKYALSNYMGKLMANSVYIQPYEVKEPVDFIPTPAKLKLVTDPLGLPAIEKVSKAYLSDYISDTAPVFEGSAEFLNLLGPAVNAFKAREGAQYGPFKAFCEQAILQHTPPTLKGTVLNFDSDNDLKALYYLLLGLPVRIRTEVAPGSIRHIAGLPGSPASDKSALDFALANDCTGGNEWKGEVLKALSLYTKAQTRVSNYWTPYPLWMGDDGIIHPNFLCPGTATRRPSGSNPNMLQVSKGNVRRVVKPRSPDNVIVSVDFASQELRVLASVTRDKNFLSAYVHPEGEPDKDLHTVTACGVAPVLAKKRPGMFAQLQLDPDGRVNYDWYLSTRKTDSELGKFLEKVRHISKTINFGAAYGAVGQTVSIQAMIPLEDADLAVNGMNATYPGLNIWKAEVSKFAKKWGYVATTYGSRRHCGNILATGNRWQVGRMERQLHNFLIQGQCGDLLKVVLSGAYRSRLFPRMGAYLIAPIYDELLAEVPKVNLHAYLHELADLMEIKMPGIVVPMVADCSFGKTWADQIEVGVRPTREKIEKALALLEST